MLKRLDVVDVMDTIDKTQDRSDRCMWPGDLAACGPIFFRRVRTPTVNCLGNKPCFCMLNSLFFARTLSWSGLFP